MFNIVQGFIQNIFPHSLLIMVYLYLFLKLLDFITGLLKTWLGIRPYKSSIMRKGIITWIAEMVAISFVVAIDFALNMNFYLTQLTILLFLYKESASIFENLGMLGIDIPDYIKKIVLNAFKKDGDGKDEKE